jgi:hypothetical protein
LAVCAANAASDVPLTAALASNPEPCKKVLRVDLSELPFASIDVFMRTPDSVFG